MKWNKNRLLLVLVGIIVCTQFANAQESKAKVIYYDYWQHTKITAYTSYKNDTIIKKEFYYTVTNAKKWTGKLYTITIYKGDFEQLAGFLEELLQFGENYQNKIGSVKIIEGEKVSITKKVGIFLITIQIGSQDVNVTYKDVKKSLNALKTIKQ